MFKRNSFRIAVLGLALMGSWGAPEVTWAIPAPPPGTEPGEVSPPPPPCNAEGTVLPPGQTYQVRGRIQQDCRPTDLGQIFPVGAYPVVVMVRFSMKPVCPGQRSFKTSKRVGQSITDRNGNYSFFVTSDVLNPLIPRQFDLDKMEVFIRLREPETDVVVWTSGYKTWSPFSPAVIDNTIANDCPADRFSQPFWDTPMWRLQLRIWTANVKYAGTDDSVQVRLNSRNATWLDYGRDDFERNDDFTYDLMTTGVSQRSDITQLVISKDGSEGWCIRRLQLLVNEVPMFDQSFAAPGLWLDNEDGHSRVHAVNYYALRANAAWDAFEPPPIFEVLVIPHDDLVDRLEGLLGHLAHGTGAILDGEHLYGRAVEVERVDDHTLTVDFDLTDEVNNWDDAEIDVDFDVRFSCEEGADPMALENLEVSVDVFLESLSDADEDGEEKMRRMILTSFQSTVNRLFDGDGETCLCVAQVSADGGLEFGTRPCPAETAGVVGFISPIRR